MSNEVSDLEKRLNKCKKISRAKDVGLFTIVVFIVAVAFGNGMISNPIANKQFVDATKKIKIEKPATLPSK